MTDIPVSEPKILLVDIETGKMLVKGYTYSLKQYSTYLNPDWIEKPVWMVCVAWKWLGSNVIGSVSVLNDPERFEQNYSDDFHVVNVLHNLLEEADVVVAHNGDNFDMKQINKRCIWHGLPPTKQVRTVDTLKLARRHFGFESNALRYLAKFLGIGAKEESPDWDKIAVGDAEEIKKCVAYNRIDVKVLEKLYLKLRPWGTHPNANVYQTGVHHNVCRVCGSSELKRSGYHYTIAGKYQAYRCGACRAWNKHHKNLKKVEIR